jgi:hypothetical protein
VTDIARVRTTITGMEGGTGLGTAYFANAGTIDAATALECAKRVRAFWNSIATEIVSPISLQVQSQVDVLTAESGTLNNSFGVAAQAVVVGGAANPPVPGAAQGLVQQHTGALIAGRRVIGRINVPGIVASDNVAPGVPSSTLQTRLGTAGALLNTLILTACSNIVWHRPKAGAGGAAVLVTSFTGSNKWATLRSRRD